jgi:predicted permease
MTPEPRPPRLLARLLEACLGDDPVADAVTGDLLEEFRSRAAAGGEPAALRWYRREARGTATWALGRRLRSWRRRERPKGGAMDSLKQDLGYALRALRGQPSYAAIVVATLALAIGVNTLIFTFVNLFALRPLPFENIDTLAYLMSAHPERANDRVRVSYGDYLEWRRGSRTLEQLGATGNRTFNLTGLDEPMRVRGAPTSASFFAVSGLDAVRGRLYAEDEDRPGAEPVAVLAHGFWQRQLGGRDGVVNRTILLDGVAHTVVGVMTPEIEIGGLGEIDVWTPLGLTGDPEQRELRDLMVFGRLAPGETLGAVSAELQSIARRQQRDHAATHAGWTVRVLPLRTALVGEDSWLLLGMLAVAVSFVLAIACANVANLTLARASVRARETAVRAALGAGRLRLVRQLLVEGLLLSLAGGGLGVLLAAAGLRGLVAVTFEPFYTDLELDHRVLAFSATLSLLAPVVFGLLPALQASRRDLTQALKEGGARGTIGARGGRSRRGLVVVQLAMASMLLVVAGLSIRTAVRVQSLDPGFDRRDVVTLRVDLPAARYPSEAAVRGFYSSVVDRLERTPGVEAVAATTGIPTLNDPGALPLAVEGARSEGDVQPLAGRQVVTERFFETLRLPIRRGRPFRPTDTAGSEPVAIVSEALVRRYLPDGEALGRRIRLGAAGTEAPWRRIVGIAADTVNGNLVDPPRAVAYLPFGQRPERAVLVIARSGDAATVVRAARAEVARLDPDQPIYDARTIEQWIYRETDGNRVVTGLFALFAVVAVGLAAIGLYGVISYAVSRRTQEIGVRIALGARTGDVLRMVVGQGTSLIGLGLLTGLAGGYGLARVMASQLYGVSPADPLIYASVALTLGATALLASYLPARRASRVDPIEALRTE